MYPKKVVEDFFIAFHAKDTITLKELCHPDITLQTIANTKEGNKLENNLDIGFASPKYKLILLENINEDEIWKTCEILQKNGAMDILISDINLRFL